VSFCVCFRVGVIDKCAFLIIRLRAVTPVEGGGGCLCDYRLSSVAAQSEIQVRIPTVVNKKLSYCKQVAH